VVLYPGGQGNRVGWGGGGFEPSRCALCHLFCHHAAWSAPLDPPVRSAVDPPIRSVVGPTRQVCRGTRLPGQTWLMGLARQASVGTRLWDPGDGPARQVGCGIRHHICRGTRLPGWIWLMGPAHHASVRTRLWDPLSESISGTQLSG
jgi:hypothetical protein